MYLAVRPTIGNPTSILSTIRLLIPRINQNLVWFVSKHSHLPDLFHDKPSAPSFLKATLIASNAALPPLCTMICTGLRSAVQSAAVQQAATVPAAKVSTVSSMIRSSQSTNLSSLATLLSQHLGCQLSSGTRCLHLAKQFRCLTLTRSKCTFGSILPPLNRLCHAFEYVGQINRMTSAQNCL